MEIKEEYDFDDLRKKCWSGAIDTLETIEKNEKEEEFMNFLAQEFCDEIPTLTAVNDLLWFEEDYIFKMLGINNESEE